MTMTALHGTTGASGPRRHPVIVPDHWYGVEDVARHYDLPRSTVRELIAAGKIPGTKVGRSWRAYGADIIRCDNELRAKGGARPLSGPQGPDQPTT